MKIAQVAPLIEPVPPRLYGGTERVVSYLTEELVRRGHDVTLFASADSRTSAELVPCAPAALRLGEHANDPLPHMILMLERVRQRVAEFDIIHFHVDYVHYPLMRTLSAPHVTTLHGRLDLSYLEFLYAEYREMPVVSIADSQRAPLASANWAGTVYHGLPRDLCPFSPAGRDYLVFLGRICSEKGPDRAIDIAKRAGRELVIAAKVDDVDRDYFERRIRPLLRRSNVRFVGEVDDVQKAELLGGALALLFPIDWPEPFGLAMIEAMSCGTPVVAWPRGSVTEVLEDGVTGRIVRTVEAAAAAVDEIERIDRARVRRVFEERFSVERMAADYLEIYERIVHASASLSTAA